jgi:hypothetical protein
MNFFKTTMDQIDDIFDVGVVVSLLSLFTYCAFLVATWNLN